MARCFVIQPFDHSRYDKRYDDVFVPAIRKAGLEPYRVDRDPSVTIPIDEIENQITASQVCLAEISTDNPNVWFELGFAIARQKDVIPVCSDERKTKYPFDVQHRSVLNYTTESPSDYQILQKRIVERLHAIVSKQQQLGELSKVRSVVKVEGLEQYEVAALVAAAQQGEGPDDPISASLIRQDTATAGFTPLATNMGLRSLRSKQMIEAVEMSDYNNNSYQAYRVTDKGMEWLFANKDSLALRTEPAGRNSSSSDFVVSDDDVPF
jgi:hypothetical protein